MYSKDTVMRAGYPSELERPVFDIDTTDIEIALNSISNDVKALDEFDVVLDEDKYAHLINEKMH
jgi:hypothetical protein